MQGEKGKRSPSDRTLADDWKRLSSAGRCMGSTKCVKGVEVEEEGMLPAGSRLRGPAPGGQLSISRLWERGFDKHRPVEEDQAEVGRGEGEDGQHPRRPGRGERIIIIIIIIIYQGEESSITRLSQSCLKAPTETRARRAPSPAWTSTQTHRRRSAD